MKNISKYQKAVVIALIAAIISKIIIYRSPIAAINNLAAISTGLVALVAVLLISGGSTGKIASHYNLSRIGLVNRAGEAPLLVASRTDPAIPNGMLLTFETRGIPRETWEDMRDKIESALNIFIVKIVDGKDRRHVVIHAVPASHGLSACVPWSPKYLFQADCILALGKSLSGIATVDLAVSPHVLIGGSTGSGKSILLKNLLYQCIRKGATVYIADFKGGLDYGCWEDSCRMIFDEESLLQSLQNIAEEMADRKILLKDAGLPNIHEFNAYHSNDPIPRIILACDEVAEVLDKTGRTKEDKERIDKIAAYLSTIARLGRAMGIHLILATQRPDANIIPGQIKNNMDCRICGRADNVLSQIILDCADAADQIPKDARGRFLTNDGTLIQGFWFDEGAL